MKQLDLLQWADERPTAKILNALPVILLRIRTGQLRYGETKTDEAQVISLPQKGAA
ncbi:hypothetical protein [Rhizobium herbae]|uniref:Excisionase n=1 Tax=Rhizobium herbae TaxID=508661 RepID=A0ABS4EFW4_9HYPH|nr:hypothetical protein [Rhizobium herbae]MBP1856846.1 hypothetical protein [Rhizobium herbae]